MKRPPLWTKAEDSLLGTMPDEKLARKLNRSIEAVKGRRHLKRISTRRPWQPGENKLLGTQPDSAISKLVGRVTSVVSLRRRQLGIPPFQDKSGEEMEKKLAALTDEQIARLMRKSHFLKRTPTKSKKAPAWTSREDELLGKWPDERVARFLDRTPKAVAGRRQALGILNGPSARRWTEEEMRLLEPSQMKGRLKQAVAQVAGQVGRSAVAVAGKRRALHGSTQIRRPWTKRELKMLGTRPDSEVAAAIGRQCGTVQVRRGDLGIKSFRERNQFQWSAETDRLLGTRRDSELAKHLRVPLWAVKARRQQLGISSSVYRKWTRQEEQLIGTMPDQEVARITGRTAKAIMHRRLSLERQH